MLIFVYRIRFANIHVIIHEIEHINKGVWRIIFRKEFDENFHIKTGLNQSFDIFLNVFFNQILSN